mgnify:CR=1 FL=1
MCVEIWVIVSHTGCWKVSSGVNIVGNDVGKKIQYEGEEDRG